MDFFSGCTASQLVRVKRNRGRRDVRLLNEKKKKLYKSYSNLERNSRHLWNQRRLHLFVAEVLLCFLEASRQIVCYSAWLFFFFFWRHKKMSVECTVHESVKVDLANIARRCSCGKTSFSLFTKQTCPHVSETRNSIHLTLAFPFYNSTQLLPFLALTTSAWRVWNIIRGLDLWEKQNTWWCYTHTYTCTMCMVW